MEQKEGGSREGQKGVSFPCNGYVVSSRTSADENKDDYTLPILASSPESITVEKNKRWPERRNTSLPCSTALLYHDIMTFLNVKSIRGSTRTLILYPNKAGGDGEQQGPGWLRAERQMGKKYMRQAEVS